MKKYIKSLSIVFLVLFTVSAFAHSSGFKRNYCFLWLKKYNAFAEVKYLSKYEWQSNQIQTGWHYVNTGNGYQWIPQYATIWSYNPVWIRVAHHVDRSCPVGAYAQAQWYHNFGGSTGWRVGNAAWFSNSSGSYNVTQYSNHWRIKAGLFEKMYLDREKFEAMDKEGYTSSDIHTNLALEDNHLVIENMEGDISIAENSNFYSTVRIVVFKESTSISEEDLKEKEELYKDMKYDNVVMEGGITVRKDEITLDGFFKDQFEIEEFKNEEEGAYGLSLEGLSFNIPIELMEDLEEDEILSYAIYTDGGLDLSSVEIDVDNLSLKKAADNLQEEKDIKVYPNPSASYLNVDLNQVDDSYRLEMINVSGQVMNITTSKTNNGFGFSTTDLPNGVYFLRIYNASKAIETRRVIIQH